jgi:hypothetical protein
MTISIYKPLVRVQDLKGGDYVSHEGRPILDQYFRDSHDANGEVGADGWLSLAELYRGFVEVRQTRRAPRIGEPDKVTEKTILELAINHCNNSTLRAAYNYLLVHRSRVNLEELVDVEGFQWADFDIVDEVGRNVSDGFLSTYELHRAFLTEADKFRAGVELMRESDFKSALRVFYQVNTQVYRMEARSQEEKAVIKAGYGVVPVTPEEKAFIRDNFDYKYDIDRLGKLYDDVERDWVKSTAKWLRIPALALPDTTIVFIGENDDGFNNNHGKTPGVDFDKIAQRVKDGLVKEGVDSDSIVIVNVISQKTASQLIHTWPINHSFSTITVGSYSYDILLKLLDLHDMDRKPKYFNKVAVVAHSHSVLVPKDETSLSVVQIDFDHDRRHDDWEVNLDEHFGNRYRFFGCALAPQRGQIHVGQLYGVSRFYANSGDYAGAQAQQVMGGVTLSQAAEAGLERRRAIQQLGIDFGVEPTREQLNALRSPDLWVRWSAAASLIQEYFNKEELKVSRREFTMQSLGLPAFLLELMIPITAAESHLPKSDPQP